MASPIPDVPPTTTTAPRAIKRTINASTVSVNRTGGNVLRIAGHVQRACTEGDLVPNRVLLRGGHILSMDPQIGDLYGGDILVEGDKIAAVGPSVDAGDAEVIDSTGCIVIPGFID